MRLLRWWYSGTIASCCRKFPTDIAGVATKKCYRHVRWVCNFLGATSHDNGSITMRTTFKTAFLTIICLGFATVAMGQKPKIIVDQDARGPASTDMQSILMFAQSPDVEVLGITLVTGDQWVKEET